MKVRCPFSRRYGRINPSGRRCKTYGELIDTRGTSDAAGAAYWIDFFQQHKDSAERKKGVLEVTL